MPEAGSAGKRTRSVGSSSRTSGRTLVRPPERYRIRDFMRSPFVRKEFYRGHPRSSIGSSAPATCTRANPRQPWCSSGPHPAYPCFEMPKSSTLTRFANRLTDVQDKRHRVLDQQRPFPRHEHLHDSVACVNRAKSRNGEICVGCVCLRIVANSSVRVFGLTCGSTSIRFTMSILESTPAILAQQSRNGQGNARKNTARRRRVLLSHRARSAAAVCRGRRCGRLIPRGNGRTRSSLGFWSDTRMHHTF